MAVAVSGVLPNFFEWGWGLCLGACEASIACSTCHVVVDPIWYEAVGAADEDEEDMLDLAHDPRRTSRLGCQVKLTPALDGMVVWVPHGANNMMDDIPEWSTDR